MLEFLKPVSHYLWIAHEQLIKLEAYVTWCATYLYIVHTCSMRISSVAFINLLGQEWVCAYIRLWAAQNFSTLRNYMLFYLCHLCNITAVFMIFLRNSKADMGNTMSDGIDMQSLDEYACNMCFMCDSYTIHLRYIYTDFLRSAV